MRSPTAALVVALLCHAALAHALTVDELVKRHIDARGGVEKLRALRSLRLTGTVVYSGEGYKVEAAWARAQKRDPKKPGGALRTEVTLQGLTAIDAWDGEEAAGWSLDPFGGRRDAERSSTDEAKPLAHEADLDGPLVRWREKGDQLDSLGSEDLDGTMAHKLRLSRKDGDVEYVYLDPDAFLILRVISESKVRGVERVTETDLGSYHQVAGVWIPFSIESGKKGGPKSQRITVERAEGDVDLDNAMFRFPPAGSPIGRKVIAGPPAVAATPAAAPPAPTGPAPRVDAGVISGLGARNIGSAAMSGRIAAVVGHGDGGKTTLYVGAASGGVWKSTDGGTTFKPIFDRNPVQSIGALALDPQNPKTIWVGTGEAWTRNSTSVGDGIYKSTDGGESWAKMGLPGSERIVRILVHPKNGDVVYACVPGRLWSDSAERGLYKTVDGGKTWSLVLKGSNLSTGCSSVAMDPQNPEILLAGLWDFRRKGWTFRSGPDAEVGPGAPGYNQSGSGLHRSTDGGKSWSAVTAASSKGLPAAPWGRVEVAFAPSDAKIVYAFIESRDSALYRSADGGATWEQRDKSQKMVWRPFYFARLIVDPQNPNRLFKPDLGLIVSDDGGRSFAGANGGAHGDWHDLWIDPANPKRMVGGDDGGLWISQDGGSRWSHCDNLPVSQFYHVAVDAKDPYQVYGGLQDNSSWVGDSSYPNGISNARWENLYDSDGFWVVVDPSDPEAVYVEGQGGYMARVDRRTHVARDIQPKAGYKEKLRFNWNTPIVAGASPVQRGGKGVIYAGAQFLFRSRDRGDTWERISPDLTTNDPAKQKQELSGGVTVDNSAAEMHTTIYSISESPRDAKTIWVGTDDGNLQLTRDAGKTWHNLAANVPGLPPSSWVSWVEASRHDAGTAYAAFDRHTVGDFAAWVYRTTDFGASWKRIAGPEQGVRGFAHVIKEDTQKKNLLFLGTEHGLWISVDGGGAWAEFKGGNFPSVAVRDLQIHPREHDLVLGTHGRGIWIVDDITPLRALGPDLLGKSVAFLPGRPVQQRMATRGGWAEGDAHFVGDNPASGAGVSYYQRTRHVYGPIKLEIFDAAGKLVDTLPTAKRRGVNRVEWAMQLPPPRVPRAAQLAFSASQGPRVLPGLYKLRLTRGAEVIEAPLPIGLDRRAPYNAADRKLQQDAVLRAHALFGEMSTLCDRLDGARAAALARRATLPQGDALAAKLDALAASIQEEKKKIVATKEGGAITGEERIREHLDIVYGALNGFEGRPARYQVDRVTALARELDDVRKSFDAIAAREIAPLDEELRQRKLDPIPTRAVPTGAKTEAPLGAETAALLRCARGGACEDLEARAARR